jgi:hypothetical protein
MAIPRGGTKSLRFFLNVKRDIHAPVHAAWDLLTDTTRWPLWGPTTRDVVCTERWTREGSSGQVLTPAGGWVPFIVTGYEHAHFWSWRVAGIRATGQRLIAHDGGSCRIVFKLPYLWFPYALVCRRAVRNLARLLEGG